MAGSFILGDTVAGSHDRDKFAASELKWRTQNGVSFRPPAYLGEQKVLDPLEVNLKLATQGVRQSVPKGGMAMRRLVENRTSEEVTLRQ